MASPGLSVEAVFRLTRSRVVNASDGAQVPWEASSLIGNFYFLPNSTTSRPTPIPISRPTPTYLPPTPVPTPVVTMTPIALSYPEFPWPPPRSSATVIIPYSLLMKNLTTTSAPKMRDVVQRFEHAFNLCGYVEKSYYSVPDGFAIVTRLEQINSDGTPKENSERWIAEIQPLRKFSLDEYLKALFKARIGYYRVIVFIITPHPFSQTNVETSATEAQVWLSDGLNVLPNVIGQKEFVPEYQCTALVYEFEQHSTDEKPELVIPGRLTGKAHVTNANLWEALENSP